MSPGYTTENGITLRPGDRVQIQGTKATAYMVKVSKPRKDDPWQWAYPSKFEVMVGSLKGMEEVIKVHGPALRKAIEQAEKRNKSIMVTRRQNMTPEESVQRWYDYNTTKSTFEYKVPSVLIAKVLKSGERVK